MNNMIINKDFYKCPKCNNIYSFDTSRSYSKNCPKCKIEMIFTSNSNCDTERVVKTAPPDKKPSVKCPYCQSTNTKKLDVVDRGVSFSFFGFASSKVGKQWHCNSCKSDF